MSLRGSIGTDKLMSVMLTAPFLVAEGLLVGFSCPLDGAVGVMRRFIAARTVVGVVCATMGAPFGIWRTSRTGSLAVLVSATRDLMLTVNACSHAVFSLASRDLVPPERYRFDPLKSITRMQRLDADKVFDYT